MWRYHWDIPGPNGTERPSMYGKFLWIGTTAGVHKFSRNFEPHPNFRHQYCDKKQCHTEDPQLWSDRRVLIAAPFHWRKCVFWTVRLGRGPRVVIYDSRPSCSTNDDFFSQPNKFSPSRWRPCVMELVFVKRFSTLLCTHSKYVLPSTVFFCDVLSKYEKDVMLLITGYVQQGYPTSRLTTI